MRRIFMWIVLLPAALVFLVFALNNRGGIAIDLWPFGIVIEMPVYLAFIIILFFGALLGGIASLISGGKARSMASAANYEAEVKRRELEKLKSRCESLEAELKQIKSSKLSEQASDLPVLRTGSR